MPPTDDIRTALATIPPGRWLVGVSGGADSVALLRAVVAMRQDIEPIVVHLNHETRGEDSDADATFVRALGEMLRVQTIAKRIRELDPIENRNAEARFRLARFALFRQIAAEQNARGVLLAHHADDIAETAVLRVLRGGEAHAVAGLKSIARVEGMIVVRPLLRIRRAALHDYLQSIGQRWRKDESNASHAFARNRVRSFLQTYPALFDSLVRLHQAAESLGDWIRGVDQSASSDELSADTLAELPDILGRIVARGWLTNHGSPLEALSIEVTDRLLSMARDRATPAKQMFPGKVVVRRRGMRLSTE